MALKKASKQLNRVFEKSKSNHLLYLVIFSFLVIICIWFLAKLAHITRSIKGN